ncbi:MAG: beta-ketoacyl synthase N-terminal-like domain-containing protein [Myxococcota bacterium]
MKDLAGEPFMVAMDPTLGAMARGDRMLALARSALTEVLDSFTAAPPREVLVYLGLPEVGASFSETQARSLCDQLTQAFSGRADLGVVPVTEGNAAGLIAMQRAVEGVERGQSQFAIVAGVDSWIDPDLLEGLDEAGRLMSEANSWGFPPGEAGGAVLVCRPGVAQTFKLPNLGQVSSLGVATEEASMHAEAICTGEGLSHALRSAIMAAGGPVTKQYCDLDGERYREHELSYAILRVPRDGFVNPSDFVTPVPSWGNVGAATAPLLTILPLLAHARGFSPGLWPMIWCGSENGKRGAMVLHLPT